MPMKLLRRMCVCCSSHCEQKKVTLTTNSINTLTSFNSTTYMRADIEAEKGLQVRFCAQNDSLEEYCHDKGCSDCIASVIKELAKWA